MLKKQRGNMYEFVETFNPLGGECSHKCSYCYRKSMMRFPVNKEKYSGKPRLIYGKSGMNKNLGNGNFWFVGSMTDIFAKDVPNEMIIEILEYCNKFSSNKYLFQSKNPGRFWKYFDKFPENTTLCTTIESDVGNFSLAPHPIKRGIWMQLLKGTQRNTEQRKDIKTMITIEPITKFSSKFYLRLKFYNPDQINIGSDSGNNNLSEPSKEKILELISELEKFTIVHQKRNLKRLLK